MKYLCPFLALLLVLLARPAHATILFAGGEDSDFTCPGSCVVSANTGFFDSTFARESYGAAGATGDPPPNYLQSPTFTAGSTLWIHASAAVNGSVGNAGNEHIIDVLSPDGVTRITLRQASGTTGFYKIGKRDSTGVITDLVTTSTPCITLSTTISKLDLFINYAVSGEVSFFCNGSRIADFTGDVTTNSATQLNQFRLSSVANGSRTQWSEVIAGTVNTTSARLATLPPVANGNTDTWDVGGVANVNEVILNDATVNASATQHQVQLYTIGSLPSTTLQIHDVVVSGRALVDTTGPQHLQAVVRTGGSNFNSVSMAPQVQTFGPNWIDFPTNPNTTNPWVPSDLGAGFNFGYESIN